MSDYKDPFCILPLRDIVVFPNMIVPLFVGRTKSIKAILLDQTIIAGKRQLDPWNKTPGKENRGDN